MRRAVGLAVLAVATVGAGEATADCRYSRDYEAEERSWVGWSPMKVGYRDDSDGKDKDSIMVLSARIVMVIPIGFSCGTPQHGELLLQLLPSLNLSLTQLADHSSAVLPPSFNPRILRAGLRYRWWKDNKDWISPNGREHAFGLLGTAWNHHSNGQYAPSYYDDKGATTDLLTDALNANRENGDFATNYIGATGWYRLSWLDDNGNRPAKSLFVSAEYQFHHGAVFPGGLNLEKLAPIWGRHHLLFSSHFRTGYQHDPKGDVKPRDDGLGGAYLVFGLDAWWAVDAGEHRVVSSHRWRGALEAAWFVPRFLGPAGVFARATLGRNPLNIRFVENRNEFIVGLMLDTSQSIERLGPD